MTGNNQPKFFVGPTPIMGDVILAPMDGVSDQPFRSIAREFGSAISYTEFVNAKEVVSNIKLVIPKLAFEALEHPLAVQVYDDDPYRILDASMRLMAFKPDILDVNLGCSVKTVASRGAGAGLLKDPVKVRMIMELLSKNIPIPVTAKIRLGWDDDQLNYLHISRIIEESGGKAVAVHGRTRQQNYNHPARWQAIREVKEAIGIPVIGNGDIRTPEDIDRMLAETNCDAVMIGRAAIGNPWLLKRKDKNLVGSKKIIDVTLVHLEKSIRFYGEQNGIRKFRKFLKAYLSGMDLGKYRIQDLLSEDDPGMLIASLKNVA